MRYFGAYFEEQPHKDGSFQIEDAIVEELALL